MGDIGDFLKYIPDAAKSPLAFVAYVLVLGAWLIRTWLLINPLTTCTSFSKPLFNPTPSSLCSPC
jgi:hypothetical protein